jgi:DNA polymerase bacteriophage-type
MSAVNLHLDFETASRIDLKERGLDNYSKDPSTHVLMMAWAVNEALPQMWFPQDGPLPEHLELMIRRPEIKKAAFNAEFERTILRDVLKIDTPVSAWSDCMINARYASIAGNLEFVGKVLGLPEDKAKLATGKKLIKLFCSPNKKGEFNTRETHPEEWAAFVEYCKQDVIAEREIGEKLKAFSLPSTERRGFELDQEINERGIPTDPTFITNAARIVSEERNKLLTEFKELTSLENPNSTKQLLEWLKTKGYPYGSLGAKWVTKALAGTSATEEGRRGLDLRQQLAKSSTAKLEALKNFVSADGNLRRQYVFMGAARTGRWSGRAVQLQNLPRPTIKDTEGGVKAILSGSREAVRKIGPPLEVVASCLRSAFRAPKGKKFVVCDLASIEVVVLGWVAGCPGILKVFEEGRDAYVDFGTRMFNRDYADLDPDTPGISDIEKKDRKEKRQLAKPAVLGCGYGLGGGAEGFDKNGDEIRTGLWGYSLNMGVDMPQETAQMAVDLYRRTYTEVPAAWRKLEAAAIAAVRTGEKQTTCKVTYGSVKPCKLLYCILPSGRRLSYVRPRLEAQERWDGEVYSKLSYEGTVIGSHWGKNWTWGGKLVENNVQSISRDLLLHGMLRAKDAGFTIVGHTHDEIIACEDANGSLGLEQLRECMISRPAWGLDIPLDADGFEDEVYRKG